MYSEIVMDHFKKPRNVGEIKDADGIGEVGNPICGDMMKITIKVKKDTIEDIKFLTFGCGAAIAVSSMVAEMAMGKSIEEAKQITKQSVADALGGLPKNKLHCSNLGADALQMAIKDFEDRKAGIKRKPEEPDGAQCYTDIEDHDHGCKCPYCEADVEEDVNSCNMCGRTFEKGACH